MSDAEHRDPDGLRIGGWVPESEVEPPTGTSASLRADHDSVASLRAERETADRTNPRDAVTELLPAVRDNHPPVRRDTRSQAARSHQPTQELMVVGGIWRGDPLDQEVPPRRSAGRIVLGVLAALLGLGAVIAVPLTVGSTPPPQDATAWEFEPGPDPLEQTPATSSSSAAASPQRSASPTASPSATPAALVSTVGPTPTPSPSPSPTPSPNPFAPLTLQAENGVLGPPAATTQPPCAPGVTVVRLIGDWPNETRDGTLTFTNLQLAPGSYTMTVHYVMSSDPSRDAQIRFIGPNPTTIRPNFPAAACMTSKTLQVSVPAGTTAIEFSNSTDRAPSIDKIVLSR
jgi:hypothetical protein